MFNDLGTSPLTDEDYDAISKAVMETERGRWFVQEFTRRNKQADTDQILARLDALESRFEDKDQSAPSVIETVQDNKPVIDRLSQVLREIYTLQDGYSVPEAVQNKLASIAELVTLSLDDMGGDYELPVSVEAKPALVEIEELDTVDVLVDDVDRSAAANEAIERNDTETETEESLEQPSAKDEVVCNDAGMSPEDISAADQDAFEDGLAAQSIEGRLGASRYVSTGVQGLSEADIINHEGEASANATALEDDEKIYQAIQASQDHSSALLDSLKVLSQTDSDAASTSQEDHEVNQDDAQAEDVSAKETPNRTKPSFVEAALADGADVLAQDSAPETSAENAQDSVLQTPETDDEDLSAVSEESNTDQIISVAEDQTAKVAAEPAEDHKEPLLANVPLQDNSPKFSDDPSKSLTYEEKVLLFA
jgi:chemotaxis protein CheZ